MPFTAHWIRSFAVIGARASLLLLEAALTSESGVEEDATVPGINFCASAAETENRIEQLFANHLRDLELER